MTTSPPPGNPGGGGEWATITAATMRLTMCVGHLFGAPDHYGGYQNTTIHYDYEPSDVLILMRDIQEAYD